MLVRFLQENVKNDSFFEIYLEKVSACFANIHHHKNGNPFLDYTVQPNDVNLGKRKKRINHEGHEEREEKTGFHC